MILINIAKDFSEKPFGRYHTEQKGHPSDGKWTGERFRTEHLLKAFKNNSDEKITVYLDDVKRGFGSSFLEESFGGLVREGISKKQIKKRLVINSKDKDYIDEIWEYIEEAREL
jgi:hypothetical protein